MRFFFYQLCIEANKERKGVGRLEALPCAAATMAFRTSSMLKTVMGSFGCRFSYRRCSVAALPSPLERAVDCTTETLFLKPELDRESEKYTKFEVPTFSSGGSMELMAVPKKKVSKHKRGIRNGPKALKPIPVIIRCKSCGRVKLPHFYCCSGDRGTPGQENDSTS